MNRAESSLEADRGPGPLERRILDVLVAGTQRVESSPFAPRMRPALAMCPCCSCRICAPAPRFFPHPRLPSLELWSLQNPHGVTRRPRRAPVTSQPQTSHQGLISLIPLGAGMVDVRAWASPPGNPGLTGCAAWTPVGDDAQHTLLP